MTEPEIKSTGRTFWSVGKNVPTGQTFLYHRGKIIL